MAEPGAHKSDYKSDHLPDTGMVGLGLIVGAGGLYLTLAGFGLVAPPAPVHAPGFLMVCAGLACLGGGGSVAIRGFAAGAERELPADTPRGLVALSALCGIVAFAPLAIIASWIALGTGAPSSSAMLFGPLSETAGRIVFGLGALIAWLALAGFLRASAKKLRVTAPPATLNIRKYGN
ncbi:MAG: hypothetical protein KIT76_03660 [Pseudolabrys sp.]|nr:hypothetical protein [Pseudolabrys sp.]